MKPENSKHTLTILSRHITQYQKLIEDAQLPGLEITTVPSPDVDIILGEPTLIRDALPLLPALSWVQAVWAGVEPLLDPALRRDYILTNARGVFGGLMSEFVLGYLLLHERKILHRLESQHHHRWDSVMPGTLRGKTIGLLGVGSIGAELARTAKFFGMTVRGYTRASSGSEFVDEYFHHDQLMQFAAGLDYLVSVLPNTRQTARLVDARVFAALPAHALFINVGRGSTVDEKALAQALETGTVAGAVLDVFEQEPLPPDHFFWDTKNLLITSHTSAPSLPADIGRLFIENYMLFHAGKPMKYRVDFEMGY